MGILRFSFPPQNLFIMLFAVVRPYLRENMQRNLQSKLMSCDFTKRGCSKAFYARNTFGRDGIS